MRNKNHILTIQKREGRKRRTRSKIIGTADCPRLSVFRSLKHISVQLIDDAHHNTLISMNENGLSKNDAESIDIKNKDLYGTKNMISAYKVGFLLAKQALSNNIKSAIFDRGYYRYHGRVEAVANGARDGGLII